MTKPLAEGYPNSTKEENMRKKVEEPERLDRFIQSFRSYHQDTKGVILRLVDQLGDVSEVSKLTGIAERTIYTWLKAWNKKKGGRHV